MSLDKLRSVYCTRCNQVILTIIENPEKIEKIKCLVCGSKGTLELMF